MPSHPESRVVAPRAARMDPDSVRSARPLQTNAASPIWLSPHADVAQQDVRIRGQTEHWKHLRSTNPIESTVATVRLRERVTKGAGSRTAGLTMAFKLLEAAAAHWRRLDAPELVPLVRAGVRFVDGVQVEREAQDRKRRAACPRTTRSHRPGRPSRPRSRDAVAMTYHAEAPGSRLITAPMSWYPPEWTLERASSPPRYPASSSIRATPFPASGAHLITPNSQLLTISPPGRAIVAYAVAARADGIPFGGLGVHPSRP